jgi:hypothetical protein
MHYTHIRPSFSLSNVFILARGDPFVSAPYNTHKKITEWKPGWQQRLYYDHTRFGWHLLVRK